jgi:hypothetical protein
MGISAALLHSVLDERSLSRRSEESRQFLHEEHEIVLDRAQSSTISGRG